jgi:DNA-binding winged helix-turn-helix (wHTH) protein/TolB-like protein
VPDAARLRFGIFDFDTATRELRREGTAVRLQAQPAHVLSLLLATPGDIVSRETLRNALWGADTFVDFDRNLNFCVAQIRSALGDSADSPRFVKTLPKRGYQFIAPVAGAEPAVSAELPAPRQFPIWKLVAIFLGGVLLAAALLFGFRRLATAVPAPVRVAIARFDNQTGDSRLDRFADGVTDTLVAEMTAAGSGNLAVIGNASVLRLPREKRDLAVIASSTKARYVVIGQVQQSSSGVRVLAHLIRLPDGSHIKVARLDPVRPDDLNDFGTAFAKHVAAEFPARILADSGRTTGSSPAPTASIHK